jgi:hypothetical protein
MLNKTWIMTEDGLMNEKISMAEALKLQQKEVEEAQEQLEEVQELLEAEQLEREKELERLERNNDD